MPTHPTAATEDAIRRIATAADVPPPPARPVRGECCDRDCDPCVWDYWLRALRRWAERHGLGDDVERALASDPGA